MKLPEAAATALNMQTHMNQAGGGGAAQAASAPTPVTTPPIATQCFMLSNMFDPMK